MKKYSSFLLALFIYASACSQSADETSIRKVLQHQLQAWNKGDVTNYMKGYWENDSLMFIGKSGVTYGWKNTLENYKKGYPDTTAMGQLSFNILQVKLLSTKYAHVIGKWHLERTIGNLDGHFTLVFEKIKGEWVIISDHSS